MLKNVQFKIILVFFLVGILIISGLGIFFLNSLNILSTQVGQTIEYSEISNLINNINENTKTILLIASILFSVIGILVAIFLSRFVIYPINNLIQSAEKIANDDKNLKQIKKIGRASCRERVSHIV